MRRRTITAALVAVGALVSFPETPLAVATSCAPYVTRGSTDYFPDFAAAAPRRAALVAGAHSACGTDRRGRPVRVRRIRGVPLGLAVQYADRPRDRRVLVATGYFTALPDHPMHRLIFPSPKRDGLRDSCSTSEQVTAPVATAPHRNYFELRLDDGRFVPITVDSETKVTTRRSRFGLPFLNRGDLVTVAGIKCQDNFRIVATSIAPAE